MTRFEVIENVLREGLAANGVALLDATAKGIATSIEFYLVEWEKAALPEATRAPPPDDANDVYLRGYEAGRDDALAESNAVLNPPLNRIGVFAAGMSAALDIMTDFVRDQAPPQKAAHG